MEDKYSDIDESKLSPMERLGLAYCRMNRWQWDEKIAPKPEGFDAMNHDEKSRFIFPQMVQIEKMLGEPYTNRCWWMYELKKDETEWLEWRKSRIAEEKEDYGEQYTERTEKDSERLHDKVTLVLAFFVGFTLGALFLLVLKAIHGGFAA